MLAGYYWVYILTPVNLTWHLQTSLNRLLAQLWPSAVFAYFLTTRTIEEVVAKRQRVSSKAKELSCVEFDAEQCRNLF